LGLLIFNTQENKETAMTHRKTKTSTRQPKFRLIGKQDTPGLGACFAGQEQVLLPLLDLVQDTRASIDELMNEAGRCLVEHLLVCSAQEIAGAKHPGKHTGDLRWHGTQRGRITLAERKLSVKRPRLRGSEGEIAIPAYERLRADRQLAGRIRDILVTGVSTRQYAKVLPAMAGTVGIKKSRVSDHFIKASEQALEQLMQRRLDTLNLLAIYLDGIVVDTHHILAAVGVDVQGKKHLLGLSQGASENAQVAKDLLHGLLKRGLDREANYLFVIDGSKALRCALEELFGQRALVQRCRTHKVRNVTERISDKTVKAQTKSVMHAAYKLPAKEGIGRLQQQAKWLQRDYPDAAASLLEGLEETFTVNQLHLTPSLMRCLSTTNIIENPNGAVRRITRRVSRYRDADMALRWTATGFLEAEKSFRKIQGVKDLWVLETALGRNEKRIDEKRSIA
jgi:transposase-like protein